MLTAQEIRRRYLDFFLRHRHEIVPSGPLIPPNGERRNELTYEEQLQYQIELLKRELVKKEAEVLRLKKRNERKGGDARKR